ncbi:hypothetical protein PRIPAC_87419 [Pristionchus pacificus]|nr:hypothetical protein PRIPAC_87419 [Pristionchus pacificus]
MEGRRWKRRTNWKRDKTGQESYRTPIRSIYELPGGEIDKQGQSELPYSRKEQYNDFSMTRQDIDSRRGRGTTVSREDPIAAAPHSFPAR